MKKHYYNEITISSLMLFAVLASLTPFPAIADSKVVTVSNSGVSTNAQVSSSGKAEVEISNTTIINGERSTYYYATSGPGTIKHTVSIENGIVIPRSNSGNQLPLFQTPDQFLEKALFQSTFTPIEFGSELSEEEIQWIWQLINYLHTYVQKNF